MSIRIDEEFKNLIPPLSPEEYKQLEENCVRDGIIDPLVVWPQENGDNILIDGHNRWDISAKHAGIHFDTKQKHFNNREEAKAWIIEHQLGRRNIPPFVRAELALKLKPMIEAKAKANQGARTDISQKSVESHDTQKELAKAAGVSHDTIHKVEKIKEKAEPEVINALRKGNISVNKAYSDIVAEENENRRQREARELREAKRRVREFEDTKVVAIGAAKQNSEDKRLIFKEFLETVWKAREAARHIVFALDRDVTMEAIKAADRRELIHLQDELQEDYRRIIKIQRKIAEAIDEK